MIRRNTIQQALILETVNRLQCHATAEDVFMAVTKEHPYISMATVYRILNRLAESGQIRKVEVPDGADRFDHRCHNHYHARCIKCGQVFDVDMEYISDLEKMINDSGGFVFSGHDIMFKGICRECMIKQNLMQSSSDVKDGISK